MNAARTQATETKRTAAQIVESLRATAQLYHEGRIDRAEMSARNRADWQDAERNRVTLMNVQRMMREE